MASVLRTNFDGIAAQATAPQPRAEEVHFVLGALWRVGGPQARAKGRATLLRLCWRIMCAENQETERCAGCHDTSLHLRRCGACKTCGYCRSEALLLLLLLLLLPPPLLLLTRCC